MVCPLRVIVDVAEPSVQIDVDKEEPGNCRWFSGH